MEATNFQGHAGTQILERSDSTSRDAINAQNQLLARKEGQLFSTHLFRVFGERLLSMGERTLKEFDPTNEVVRTLFEKADKVRIRFQELINIDSDCAIPAGTPTYQRRSLLASFNQKRQRKTELAQQLSGRQMDASQSIMLACANDILSRHLASQGLFIERIAQDLEDIANASGEPEIIRVLEIQLKENQSLKVTSNDLGELARIFSDTKPPKRATDFQLSFYVAEQEFFLDFVRDDIEFRGLLAELVNKLFKAKVEAIIFKNNKAKSEISRKDTSENPPEYVSEITYSNVNDVLGDDIDKVHDTDPIDKAGDLDGNSLDSKVGGNFDFDSLESIIDNDDNSTSENPQSYESNSQGVVLELTNAEAELYYRMRDENTMRMISEYPELLNFADGLINAIVEMGMVSELTDEQKKSALYYLGRDLVENRIDVSLNGELIYSRDKSQAETEETEFIASLYRKISDSRDLIIAKLSQNPITKENSTSNTVDSDNTDDSRNKQKVLEPKIPEHPELVGSNLNLETVAQPSVAEIANSRFFREFMSHFALCLSEIALSKYAGLLTPLDVVRRTYQVMSESERFSIRSNLLKIGVHAGNMESVLITALKQYGFDKVAEVYPLVEGKKLDNRSVHAMSVTLYVRSKNWNLYGKIGSEKGKSFEFTLPGLSNKVVFEVNKYMESPESYLSNIARLFISEDEKTSETFVVHIDPKIQHIGGKYLCLVNDDGQKKTLKILDETEIPEKDLEIRTHDNNVAPSQN